MNRIAILSVHTSPLAKPGGKKVGGMNTYVREIALEFARRGIAVDIFTRRDDPSLPRVDNRLGSHVRVINVKAGPASSLSTTDIYPHLQQFTAGVIAFTTRNHTPYDLIFSHYWLSGPVANSLRDVWGTPFVQMFHTLGHMKNRIPSVTAPVPDLRIRVESQVVEWADGIIANTPAERAQLLWLYRADRRKINVIPPGVDLNLFQPMSKAEARRALRLPEDQNLLLFAGRIEPLKAVDSIIEALGGLQQERPDVLANTRFVIIGGDPTDPADMDIRQLKMLTQQLGLEDTISFLGARSQDALARYYAAATVVMMPSEYESFGMVALEAMATGTPVIASEVGGLAYLVRDGETGFLVPSRSPVQLADRIAAMLTSPDLRDQLGHHAAIRARAYAWPSIADQLIQAFEQKKQRV